MTIKYEEAPIVIKEKSLYFVSLPVIIYGFPVEVLDT